MTVDFFATQPHYVDHLAPVWNALSETDRGAFVTSPDLDEYTWVFHGVSTSREFTGDVVVVAAWRDAQGHRGRKVALMEHGTGQTYQGHLPAYAGGVGRDVVSLFLAPNERVLELNQRATPEAEHVVVGTPKLDDWFTGARGGDGDAVTFSFHYDSQFCNEASSGFMYFRRSVEQLVRSQPGTSMYAHSHPRGASDVQRWAKSTDIGWISRFDTVLTVSRLYVCDNSSTLYEFAALDGPVVVLNPPQYRRDVEHGLRFWEYADVGVNCDDWRDLERAVGVALDDPSSVRERRREITEILYPIRDGSSARRAAKAVVGLQ